MEESTLLKLTTKLLRLAGDQFGNHGCNDFDLEEHGFTEEERLEISKAIQDSCGDDERPVEASKYEMDWLLMYAVADVLESRIEFLLEYEKDG